MNKIKKIISLTFLIILIYSCSDKKTNEILSTLKKDEIIITEASNFYYNQLDLIHASSVIKTSELFLLLRETYNSIKHLKLCILTKTDEKKDDSIHLQKIITLCDSINLEEINTIQRHFIQLYNRNNKSEIEKQITINTLSCLEFKISQFIFQNSYNINIKGIVNSN
ncbi:MAG: hypothetical protein ACOCWG_05915 [bacterium]